MDSSPPLAAPANVSNLDDSNYKYIDDVCIYTDPNTKKEYTWNKEKSTWIEKGFENYEYDEIYKTYKYVDKQTSKYNKKPFKHCFVSLLLILLISGAYYDDYNQNLQKLMLSRL